MAIATAKVIDMLADTAGLLARASTKARAGSLVTAGHLTARATRQVLPLFDEQIVRFIGTYNKDSARVLTGAAVRMQQAHTALSSGNVELALRRLGTAKSSVDLLLPYGRSLL